MSDRKRAPLQALLTAALVLLVAVGIAACGSSSSSSSSSSASTESTSGGEEGGGGGGSAGLEAAKADVEEHRGETTKFTPPGAAIDAKSLSGKSVWYIPLSASIPVLAVEAQGVQEAAKAIGLKYNTCDGKFVPASMSACITQAVNSKPAGIVIDSVDPKLVGPAMKSAEAAGIPIMGFQTTGEESKTLRFISGGDPESQVTAMNWIIADSEGKANVLAATIKGEAQTEATTAEGVKALEENCEECKYEAFSVTAPQIPTIATASSSALLKNPEAEYAFPEFDFFAPLFERGAQQAGRTSSMKMVSTNAAFSQVQEVASGGFQVADVGANRNYLGWEAMDGLLRMVLGKPAAENVTFPIRVFDETNVGSLNMSEAASTSGEWWGPTTYKQEFPKLWGLG